MSDLEEAIIALCFMVGKYLREDNGTWFNHMGVSAREEACDILLKYKIIDKNYKPLIDIFDEKEIIEKVRVK